MQIMDKLRINTGSLGSDAENIGNQVRAMGVTANELVSSLNILDSMWDGPSSEEFKRVFHDDVNALNEIISTLGKINEFEHLAKSKYDSCEKQVSELISSIRV